MSVANNDNKKARKRRTHAYAFRPFLRIPDWTKCRNTSRFHAIHNLLGQSRIADTKYRLRSALFVQFIRQGDHIRPACLARIDNHGIWIATLDLIAELSTIRAKWCRSAPEDSALGLAGGLEQEGQAGADARAGRYDDDFAEDESHGEDAGFGETFHPVACLGFKDRALRPVAGIRDDHAATAAGFRVRGKWMPFCHR